VSTAFLQSDEDKDRNEVLVRPPKALVEEGFCKDKCWMVKSALYGQADAPKRWRLTLEKFLKELEDLTQCLIDEDVYVIKDKKGQTTGFLVVYVDDVAAMGDDNAITNVLKKVKERFQCTEIAELDCYCGTEILKDDQGISLTQRKYAEEFLQKWDFDKMNSRKGPLETGDELPTALDEVDDILNDTEKKTYQQQVGKLMYYAVNTRPDLSFAVNRLAAAMSRPTARHREAAVKVMRYVKHTANFGLRYGYAREDSEGVHTWVDASWKAPHGTSGVAIYVYGNLVTWASRRQKSPAFSSAEAEIVAASLAARETSAVLNLLRELAGRDKEIPPVKLFCDSATAVYILNGKKTTRTLRHLDLADFYVRQKIRDEEWSLSHVEGDLNVSDILTKSLNYKLQEKHARGLGLLEV
jgi:hypothetical protein